MRIFLAGAAGVIGRRLTPLLVLMGHEVTGTTRSAEKAGSIEAMCARPVVVDVFDAEALTAAVMAARPEVVIHQLTDLPSAPGTPGYEEAQKRNVRLRREGTRNLMDAALAAGVKRVIAQSIAFVYAPGKTRGMSPTHSIPMRGGTRALTVAGVMALEQAVLAAHADCGSCCATAISTGRAPGTKKPGAPAVAMHIDAPATRRCSR